MNRSVLAWPLNARRIAWTFLSEGSGERTFSFGFPWNNFSGEISKAVKIRERAANERVLLAVSMWARYPESRLDASANFSMVSPRRFRWRLIPAAMTLRNFFSSIGV